MTNTQIEFYSDILEDDIVILLEVDYEWDNDSFDHAFGTEKFASYVRVDGVKILNTDLSNEVYDEVKASIDNSDYDEEISTNIENELRD